MKIETFFIDDVFVVTPKRFNDDRGFFMETFKQSAFNEAAGSETVFVQDNHSLSKDVGTIRGLHYQVSPHEQGKLVRCTRGKIVDVAVDVRENSPTFGQHIRVELGAENGKQLWVPPGFLHGFATLEPNTEVIYKVTDYYAPTCDRNIRWNDPELGIDWGIGSTKAVLSDKDNVAPAFSSFRHSV